MEKNQPSPRVAIIMGGGVIVVGIFPVLIGLGILTPARTDATSTPGWVAVALGLMFVLAGLAAIVDYGIAGGVGPDGDFSRERRSPSAPPTCCSAWASWD
jgi:hypothetical protein